VSYHNHWPYFSSRFGFEYFGSIELKPLVDPTPRHIEELVSSMKAEHVSIVIREPQFPEKVPTLIAKKTGAKLVKLPIMPGGVPNTETYIKMMDYIVRAVADAAKEKGAAGN
jgi:zinc/manganese transport system substrate-binding protein